MHIEDIKDRFVFARWCYILGEPFISDIEYDALEKEFKERYPTDVYSNRHWCFDDCPTELLNRIGRTDLIKQLSMGYYAESIPSVNTEEEYESTFGDLNEPSRVSFKIDGWNTRVSYYNGVAIEYKTRGRSGNSNLINGLISIASKRIPIMGRVAVTGELSIPNDKWETFKAITGNSDQRASVSTLIAKSMKDFASLLAFNIVIEDDDEKKKWDKYDDQYILLHELGFDTPFSKWVSNKKQLDATLRQMSMYNKRYTHLTDGVVIENSKYQLAIRLGDWKEKALYSYVESYDETQGLYGVAMVANIRPVTIEGKTYSRVSMVNIANIVENNLRIGYPISFAIRSSANVVVDVEHTYEMQKKWDGRYDEYCRKINKGEI